MTSTVALIVPALNEAESLGPLLSELPPGLVTEVIVVDNGSTDATASVARAAGARVVSEPRRGYGYACAAGAEAAQSQWLAFMDGDGSFVPGEVSRLVNLLKSGTADLALGSRLLGKIPAGSMPAHQLFGNQLVARLLNGLYGLRLTDLGPFRALPRALLRSLDMRELTYGWTVEMMVKIARRGLRMAEVPVSYRPRFAGQSKIGGNVRGTILATYRIFRVIIQYSLVR